MRNIAIRLRYDGSAYHGWQLQKKDITVACVLEDAITKVCGHPVRVTGCGRTEKAADGSAAFFLRLHPIQGVSV